MFYDETGIPDPRQTLLGRGVVLAAVLASSDIPGPFRHLGNISSLSLGNQVETRDHQTTRRGERGIDASVIASQTQTLSATLTELSLQNLALALSGEAVLSNGTPEAAAGFVQVINPVVAGRWYELRDGTQMNTRAYGVGAVTVSGGAVAGTDFLVDNINGLIFFPSGSNAVGNSVNVTVAANGSAEDVQEVRLFNVTPPNLALIFISKNAFNGRFTEYHFHKVRPALNGDLNLITDDFAELQIQGQLQQNPTYSPTSPTGTIRTTPSAENAADVVAP